MATQLTEHAGRDDADPSWAPDGSRIAFSRTGPAATQLKTIRPDGTHQTTVVRAAPSEAAPDWSPDSKRIAFAFTPFDTNGWNSQLAIVDRDGSNMAVITDIDGVYFHQPAWSPDGRRIAVARYDGTGEHFDGVRVWSMRPNGADARRISWVVWYEEHLQSLDWAPPVS